MDNNVAKIVTLIPSATEIVAFLGQKKSIVGWSHGCDFPEGLEILAKIMHPGAFNFKHKNKEWINYSD